MANSNRGQMRIVEAMLACMILIVGLAVCIRMANVYTVTERGGGIEKTATNIMSVLEDPDVIRKIIHNEGFWQPELMGLLENLLPPDTFYHLSIHSALTGELLGEVTNLAGSYNSSEVDSTSAKRVVTISLPASKTVYIPLDVMLVIDVSGSMRDKLPGDVKTKIQGAKEAASLFIGQLNSLRDRVGLVSFSTEATLRQSLTFDFEVVNASIWALAPQATTNIGGGINCSAIEFRDCPGRGEKTVWAMVLLSDGKANEPRSVNATQYALDRARDAYETGHDQNLRIYTIGLGAKDDINEALLEQIAEGPLQGVPQSDIEGQYYYTPSADELSDIYLTIAKDLMFDVQYDVVVIELTLIQPG